MSKLRDFFEAAVKFALVSTGISAALGTLTTTFGTAFFQNLAKNFLYFGLSYITSKGSEDTAQRNLGIKRAVTNPIAPRNVVYGKTRVGGIIVQRTVTSKTGSTSQNVLHNVIAVAGHEINNITKVFMDAGKGTVELDLSSDFTSATENSTTVFRCTNSAFVNSDNSDAYTSGSLVKLAFEKGDQTAANGYAIAQMSGWTTDHKMLGIAYVYINCIYDTEKFTAIPTFSFEVEGKKVFDPADTNQNQSDPTTFTYSTNPALIIRDYLMDSTYGFGAVADEINDAASGAGFVQARSDCNDSVSITSGTESRFTLNGEFVATEEPQRVLETMLSACAGQLLYNNGKFSLFVGKGRTASGTITDDKILAPIQIQTKASGKDLVNGVKATYVRPDDKYIAGEITPFKDSTFLTEDTPTGKASADYENFLDLAFPFTQSTFTAQRLARIALNYERQDQTLSVLVPLDFLSHQVGDIVNLDNDRLGYSGKDFEIIGMSFEFMDDQYLALRLSLKEYTSTIFDFFTYVADPTLPSEPPSGDNSVGSPTGLALAEFVKESQMRLHFIRASWTNNLDDKIIATEVAYKKSSDSNFDTANVSYPSTLFSFYVEPATTYNVKVRHITSTGVRSDFTGTVDITTSADRATLTDGTIGGITIESGKLYQGTGTFNNSNTGFYIDNTGQFSLKDKLSFNGTTLSISGNLTVENTISADKIVVGGIALDDLISAADQASSNYLTTFSGAVKIASAGALAGYPAELQIQATNFTNAIGTLQQGQTQLTIRARNDTSNGAIAFEGFNGTTTTEYGRFSTDGRFAVGTSSPDSSAKLTLQDADFAGLYMNLSDSSGTSIVDVRGAGSGTEKFRLGNLSSSSDNFSIRTGGSTALTIDTSQNVGIGTSSPGQTLHISATNPAIRIQESDVTNGIGDIFFNNNGIRIRSRNNASNGIIRFEGNNGSSTSEHVRIHSGGAVSIGSTSSSGKLFVNGHLRVDGAFKLNAFGNNVIEQSGTTISIGDVSENDNTILLTGYGGTSKIELNDGSIITSTSGSERVRIDGSGNLLVNRTSQIGTNKVSINYDSSGKGVAVNQAFSGSGTFMNFLISAVVKGSISTDGTSTAYNTSSDARLKDITGYARGLSVINRLNPVAYNWKADGKADEGLIAQEVKELVPNAVSGSEKDMYQMDYSKLVVHLVAGMQEQQEQIDRLQADSHTPKGLEDMSGYQDLLAVIEKLQEEVKLLKGVN